MTLREELEINSGIKPKIVSNTKKLRNLVYKLSENFLKRTIDKEEKSIIATAFDKAKKMVIEIENKENERLNFKYSDFLTFINNNGGVFFKHKLNTTFAGIIYIIYSYINHLDLNEEFVDYSEGFQSAYKNEKFPIFKNPNSKEFKEMANITNDEARLSATMWNVSKIRFFLNLNNGDVYIFPAVVLHYQAFHKILPGKYFEESSGWTKYNFYSGTGKIENNKITFITSDVGNRGFFNNVFLKKFMKFDFKKWFNNPELINSKNLKLLLKEEDETPFEMAKNRLMSNREEVDKEDPGFKKNIDFINNKRKKSFLDKIYLTLGTTGMVLLPSTLTNFSLLFREKGAMYNKTIITLKKLGMK